MIYNRMRMGRGRRQRTSEEVVKRNLMVKTYQRIGS